MDKIKINIYGIVGNAICASAEDGELVFKQIKKALDKNKKVVISFLNIEMLTTAFLNTAIGQLYGKFDEEFIKKSISVEDIFEDDKLRLKRVIDTAKVYYNDPDKFENSIKEIMEEN